MKVRLNQNKNHFLSKVAAGIEKSVAYWSGSNGAELVRGLLQFMEDTKNPDLYLTLFYSNPSFSGNEDKSFSNIIYYEWLVEMGKKIENLSCFYFYERKRDSRDLRSSQDSLPDG